MEHIELGLFGKALLNGDTTKTLLLESAVAEKAVVTAPRPPALPPPERYIHPELKQRCGGSRTRHGTDTTVVGWAIERMTGDFTLNDIAKLLKQEGWPLFNAKISVVLTRLQRQGRIQVIQNGRGPVPSVFRNPESSEETPVPAAA